jgi:hypothetical protein
MIQNKAERYTVMRSEELGNNDHFLRQS